MRRAIPAYTIRACSQLARFAGCPPGVRAPASQGARLHLLGWAALRLPAQAPGAGTRRLLAAGSLRLPKASYYRDPPEGLTPIPVAIVGRANVGKSTLFNRLQSRTKKKAAGPIARSAIVSARAGTTRDRKDATAVFGGLLLRIADTGGLAAESAVQNNTLLAQMREQVFRAVAEAEAVLFVIDARKGVTALDMEIAKMLRDEGAPDGKAQSYRTFLSNGRQEQSSVPVILIANKAEGAFIGPYLNDCYDLGLGDPVIISAKQNEGMEDLYDRLCLEVGHLQPGEESEDDGDEGEASEGYMEEGEEEDEEEEYDMEDESGDDLHRHEGSDDYESPVPSLQWMPPNPLSEDQKRALRWYANHPADPLGDLDVGLKKAVMHKEENRGELPKFWLNVPQRGLPNKEVRDYVMKYRRLEDMDRPMRLAVIGTPNSGKSSTINALLQQERCIVDETSGTTMDAIVCDWTFKDQPIKLIDTCGVYRGWQYPRAGDGFLEPGMATRKAIRRAHVVVVCLDATATSKMTYYVCPSKFELRLAQYAADEGKCVVLAVNKWDLIQEDEQAKFRDEILNRIQDKLSQIKGVPVVFMSARYNLNLAMLMTRSLALYKRWSARLPTSKLNSWLQAWMLRWPPPWKRGQKCNVKYITQTRSRPPTFVMWTNTTYGDFPKHYVRQLQNAMRDEFRISGVPLRFIFRSTLMPKPRKRLSKRDVLRWKRVGPKQAEAVMDLTAKKFVRSQRQTD